MAGKYIELLLSTRHRPGNFMHIVPFNSYNNPTEIGALTPFTDIKTEARQSGVHVRYNRQGVNWDPDVPKYSAELTYVQDVLVIYVQVFL